MVSRETSPEPNNGQSDSSAAPMDAVAFAYENLRKTASDFYRTHPEEKRKPRIIGGKAPINQGESVLVQARRRADRERLDRRYGRTRPVRKIPTDIDGRRKRRRWEPAPLGELWSKEVDSRGWGPYVHQQYVVNNWEDVVGTYIAQNTTIQMFKDKVLFLEASSYAKSKELNWLKDQILAAIEAKTGKGVVDDIKIFPPKAPSWRHGRLHVKGRGPRDTYN